MDTIKKIEHLTRMREMSTVGRFGGKKIVVFPAGSEPNPKGGRREHGPPHFSYLNKDNSDEVRVVIPSALPEKLVSIHEMPEERKLSTEEKKHILGWMQEYTQVKDEETGKTHKFRNYSRLIRRWNDENPSSKIKAIFDREGKLTHRIWSGASTW